MEKTQVDKWIYPTMKEQATPNTYTIVYIIIVILIMNFMYLKELQ
jgi:hypothetical protein